MIAPLLVAAIMAVLVAGCGGSDNGQNRNAGLAMDDPGPVHVHGLGVNPKDGALFIATHTGLFRAESGKQESKRIADRYQDTMGFTVVGPDHFLGSGHPDFQKDPDSPPLLGLIESKDAGETWNQVSLGGKADFHVLEADGRSVYGFDSSGGRLMVSNNGGRQWSSRPEPEPLLSVAIDPGNPKHMITAGERGLAVSADEGGRWRRLGAPTGMLAWPAAERLYLAGSNGQVLVSRDAGKHWQAVGEVGGQPAAFEAEGPRDLYAALHDGTVKRSTDGGESWTIRSKP